MPARWLNRFELKPGRWVYVPAPDARAIGTLIKTEVAKKWRAPNYYYHLQTGGHVAALKSHLGNRFFLKADIQNFFGSIGRSRITRCLKPLFGYERAREWAVGSTILDPTSRKTVLPYGFVQSQILASICLFESGLGRTLHRVHRRRKATVSVYVDDIIVSCSDEQRLRRIHDEVVSSAARSRLTINPEKSAPPSPQVSAFNIALTQFELRIEPARLARFSAVIAGGATSLEERGIRTYIASVCPTQLADLYGPRRASEEVDV